MADNYYIISINQFPLAMEFDLLELPQYCQLLLTFELGKPVCWLSAGSQVCSHASVLFSYKQAGSLQTLFNRLPCHVASLYSSSGRPSQEIARWEQREYIFFPLASASSFGSSSIRIGDSYGLAESSGMVVASPAAGDYPAGRINNRDCGFLDSIFPFGPLANRVQMPSCNYKSNSPLSPLYPFQYLVTNSLF